MLPARQRVNEIVDRLIAIADDWVATEMSKSMRAGLENEVRKLIGDLYELIEDQEAKAADDPFDESGDDVSGLSSFVLMAIGVQERGSYTSQKIVENVRHYGYSAAMYVQP